jgi:16S rRNA (cytosine967-C5)-methyltransferase
MPISPARAAAFDILLRVERDAAYASELLHSNAHNKLSTADHALATELVMGVLRWRSLLDDEITTASSQPLRKLDLEILAALRLALYQFRYLNRIPARAAIHESVELIKHARKRSAVPFVNAVLRKLSTRAQVAKIPAEFTSAQQLASAFAHPQWMVERWASEYGLAIAEKISRYNQTVPATSIRLRTPDVASELIQEKIVLTSGAFLSNARRIKSGDVTKIKAFRNVDVVIQDEASQLAATLVGSSLQKSARILDCCAAPGGKTLAIADRNSQAQIFAVELHPHRARLLKKLLRSKELTPQIQIVAADARHLPFAFTATFDRILADVPCSGTGTIARNPEIKWRLTAEDISELQSRQLAILRSALAHLVPGGRLIYSTCSLEKEENEDVVEKTLAESPHFRLVNVRLELDRLKLSGELAFADVPALTRGPYLRTLPGVHPCDGFFAAIIEKF